MNLVYVGVVAYANITMFANVCILTNAPQKQNVQYS
jgi:hypothetical protein